MPHSMFRILLNQAPNDGGGAPAGAPPASGAASPPSSPGAPGQPAGPSPDIKAMLDEFKNSVFAETRRMVESMSGKKPKGGQSADPPAESTPATAARQPNYRRFDQAAGRLGLSDRAQQRMEAAFVAENPEDPAAWVEAYAADLGLKPQQGAGAPAPAQPPTPNQPQPPTGGPPTTPAPNPVPLADLDRANLHPNRLTSDMVQRLGPDGVYKYTKDWFMKQGRR